MPARAPAAPNAEARPGGGTGSIATAAVASGAISRERAATAPVPSGAISRERASSAQQARSGAARKGLPGARSQSARVLGERSRSQKRVRKKGSFELSLFGLGRRWSSRPRSRTSAAARERTSVERRRSGVRPPPPERTEAGVRSALEASKLAGRRFSSRVHRPTIALGVVLSATGAGLEIAYTNTLGATLLFPGAAVLMLSLLPTDVAHIRHTMHAFMLLATLLFGGYLWASVQLMALVLSAYPSCPASADTGRVGGAELPLVPCWFEIGTLGVLAGGAAVALALIREILSRLHSPSRVQLDGLWRAVRRAYASFALLLCGFALLFHLSQPAAQLWANQRVALVCRYVAMAEAVLLAALLTPSRRTALHAWLDSHGEPASVAAGIAALLNSRPVHEVHELALATFRGIRLDLVAEDEMQSAASAPALHARSRRAGFGDVDAFVTHSWHDDASEKWQALQAWRVQFVATNRREPVVWLDKACLDPLHISDSLPCLPLYLAGCQKLVVLMGPTLLTRLWCVVELFIFLNMGGDRARIELCELASVASAGRLPRRSSVPEGGPSSPHARHDPAVVWPEGAPGAQTPATDAGAAARASAVLPFDTSGGTHAHPHAHPAPTLLGSAASASDVESGYRWELDDYLDNFDVMESGCTLQSDTERLLAVIQASSGGAEAFNERVRHALRGLNSRVGAQEEGSLSMRGLRSSMRLGSALGSPLLGSPLLPEATLESGLINSSLADGSCSTIVRIAHMSARAAAPSPQASDDSGHATHGEVRDISASASLRGASEQPHLPSVSDQVQRALDSGQRASGSRKSSCSLFDSGQSWASNGSRARVPAPRPTGTPSGAWVQSRPPDDDQQQ